MHKNLKVIGITGGIASGKTVATDALTRAGFTVIDADEVSRALTARGSDEEKHLCELFPAAADADGALDRKALRNIIAADGVARAKLDAYTHPLILGEIKRRLDRAGAVSTVILSAPLLFETGLDALCDEVVCVVCPYETRIKRLIARDGMSERAAADMIAAQLPDAERIARSDRTVNSNRPLDEFIADVIELFGNITNNQA